MDDVQSGRVVRVECELRVSGGEVIESSEKSGPVVYKHGTGQMLAALESKLEGMKVGEEKSGTIKASEAFGSPDAQAFRKIARAEFPTGAKLEVGARFEANVPGGTAVVLEVTAIDDDAVTTKVIHPLADKDLDFHVKVLSVRPPPPPVPTASVPPPPTTATDLDLVEDE